MLGTGGEMRSCSHRLSHRSKTGRASMKRMLFLLVVACTLAPGPTAAQGTTGALTGTVTDGQGGVVPGALARLASPALIGGPVTATTNEKGQLRFPTLPPGVYALDVELAGFASFKEAGLVIGAGSTLERSVTLKVGSL